MRLSPEGLERAVRLAGSKPVLLVGAPGIGKTAIIRQLAQKMAAELGRQFVDLGEADDKTIEAIKAAPRKFFVFLRIVAPRLSKDDISVPIRVQKVGGTEVKHIPPSELYVFSLSGIEGILFIDELSNVQSDDVMSVFAAIVNERSIGWDLHMQPNVRIIAAMNPVSDSALARELPEIISDRFIKLYVEPDIDSWTQYMLQHHNAEVVTKVVAFLRHTGMFGYNKYSVRDLPAFTTPRSWEAVVSILEASGEIDSVVEELIAGLIGAEPAAKLIEFMRLKVDVDDVIDGKVQFERLSMGEKYVVVSAVANKLRSAAEAEQWGEVKKLVKFLSGLKGDWRGLAVALVPKSVNLKIAKKIPEYVKVAMV